jgi:hypothetical protein
MAVLSRRTSLVELVSGMGQMRKTCKLRSKNLQDEDKVRDPKAHRKMILKCTRQMGYEMWTGKMWLMKK